MMGGWNDLTPREKAIAARVAIGMTNREIGQELYISTGTVKHHVSCALRKLGARNRTQLAIIASNINDPNVGGIVKGLRRSEAS
jgi:DNA-binding NarL/FixJ family response regulator